MKVQSTFYPDFISKTVDLVIISSFITKNDQIIDIWCIYAVNSREKMSHFGGVRFLAWKSGSVKFWTNIMSVSTIPNVISIVIIKVMSPSRNELECPVCFAEMKPPVHIWQCAQVVTIFFVTIFSGTTFTFCTYLLLCWLIFFVQSLSLFDFLKLYWAECHHLFSFISFQYFVNLVNHPGSPCMSALPQQTRSQALPHVQVDLSTVNCIAKNLIFSNTTS